MTALPHPRTPPSWAVLRRADRLLLATGAILAALAALSPPQFLASLRFTADALLNLAPVIALSVALAAAVKASSAEALVARAFTGAPVRAIVLAAAAGALSPFCSCGVVPLVAALLASGVPLAPVMAFWLASPVMDPAMFVLTTGTLGLEFALAKTLAALGIGLLGGFATQALARRIDLAAALRDPAAGAERARRGAAAPSQAVEPAFWRSAPRRRVFAAAFRSDAWKLTRLMVVAFVLESLMLAWLPATTIGRWLDGSGAAAIPLAVLLGVPAYLNGLAALPLVDGLIELGMNPAVGLAFLVGGGVTSVPAALAVWSLVRPAVFGLYLGLAVAGALLSGYGYAAWLAM